MKAIRRVVSSGILVAVAALLVSCPANPLLDDVKNKVDSANEGAAEYHLTVNTTTGGIVSPSGVSTVKQDAPTAIAATPNSGYTFVNWTVIGGSGAAFGNADSASTTVTLSSGNATIQANFARIYYKLSLQSGSNGAITAPSSSPVTVAAGDSTAIQATPNGGYAFSKWEVVSGTGVSFADAGSATTTVALNGGDATIQADFTNIQYQLTVNSGGNGSTNPQGSLAVNHGSPTTISAAPSTGYQFVSWTVVSGAATLANASSASTTVTLASGPATIQANFIIAQYALTVSWVSGGTATGSGTVTYGVPVGVTATPDAHYMFVNWTVTSGSGVSFSNQASANTTVTLTGGAATIQANFALLQYQLTVSQSTGGTASGSGTVNYGAATPISAAASTGYYFVNWTVTSGSGVTFGNSTSASTTVTLTSGNATVQANFAIYQYTLTVTAGTGGSASGGGTVNYGAATSITATPSTGYNFVNWTFTSGSGVSFGNPTSASTTVTLTGGNATIKANFTLQQYTLTVTAGTGGTASGGGTVSYGVGASISATPGSTYGFQNWTVTSGSGVAFGNAGKASTTATLTSGNATIRANFAVLGSVWAATTLPANTSWTSIAFGNGVFVAIAQGTSAAAYSTDGVTWTSTSMPSSQTWYAVTYGGGKFVAVAYSSTATAYSTDGITWHAGNALPASTYWYSVAYGGSRFVAVASGNSTSTAYSTDGISWTAGGAMPSVHYWQSVCYGAGMFLAVSESQYAAYSTDGTAWTQCSLPSSQDWESVVYNGSKFVTVAWNAAAYSTNGTTWTAASSFPTGYQWNSLAYGNGVFVAVPYPSSGTTETAYSTDGSTWTSAALSGSYRWVSVAFGNGVFAAVASGTNAGSVSP